MNQTIPRKLSRVALLAAFALGASSAAWADTPPMSVGYQPMVADGLAAGKPFEAWLWLDKSSDPTVPGYALTKGATIRVRFPAQFTPEAGHPLGAVMLYGWSQGAIPTKFTVVPDASDPRVIVIHFDQHILSGDPEEPGLKAIHLRTSVLNPATAGDYPIGIEFADAGWLDGKSQAVAHITPTAQPSIAAYNQLHDGRNQDWQHAKAGQAFAMPIDSLITLPDVARASMSLAPADGGKLAILRDGKPIGTISATGVPVTLAPAPFGPGYARLGIVRYSVTAGSAKGNAEIVAELIGGTRYINHVTVE